MNTQHVTPIHPGEVLQDELKELDISPELLAKHINVPVAIICDICSCYRDIDAATHFSCHMHYGLVHSFGLTCKTIGN